jgi:putative transport protein
MHTTVSGTVPVLHFSGYCSGLRFRGCPGGWCVAGVGAVLFIGLAIGALAPKNAPPALVSSLGLIMFLYGIGVQYGKHFITGLTSRAGLRANLLAMAAILVTIGVVLVSVHAFGVKMTVASGLFAGAGTSTSAWPPPKSKQ